MNESYFVSHRGMKYPRRRKRPEMNEYHPKYGEEAKYYDDLQDKN